MATRRDEFNPVIVRGRILRDLTNLGDLDYRFIGPRLELANFPQFSWQPGKCVA